MIFQDIVEKMTTIDGIEESTLMKTPCLRYKGDFIGMFFDKADALIIKVSPERVDELIESGTGREFNYTKKNFKEWVMIPIEYEADYEAYLSEALDFAKVKQQRGKRK